MAPKLRILPISAARQALFTAAKVDANEAAGLNRQLCDPDLLKLAAAYDVDAAGLSNDQIGNMILEKYFASQNRRSDMIARNALAREYYQERFYAAFHIPLAKLCPNNVVGFDILAFEEQFIKPKLDAASRRESLREQVYRFYGADAGDMIANLVKPPEVAMLQAMKEVRDTPPRPAPVSTEAVPV
jgi:hypothetical protein